MRKINKTSTRARSLFISDLGNVIGGGCKGKGPVATTLALGEEDGGLPPGPIFTTLALGEEDGGPTLTTLALGEEDGGAL
jgi:hypothetical protein